MSRDEVVGTLLHDGEDARHGGGVRLECRVAAGVGTVWSALTEPARLAGWLGEVEGDLRPGGELRGRWSASGWEGTLRVEACEPQRRLLLHTSSAEEPDGVVEVTLDGDGEDTLLVLEDHGLPLEPLAAYGAGDQIHVEDLLAHLAGRGRCDPRARWAALHPGYQVQATALAERGA